MLEALRPKDFDTELLFVGTDRFDYFTLVWDDAKQCLETVDNFQDIGEKHLRDSQSQDRCVVDPYGRYMALLLWEGVLSVLRMKARRDRPRNLDWMDQVRLSELFVKACTFLYTETGHPKIAFLYQSQSDRRDTKLSLYRVTSDDQDAVVSRFDAARDRELNLSLDDIDAALLIPVEPNGSERRHHVRKNAANANPPHLGGLLVVGDTRVLYIDEKTHATTSSTLRTPAVSVAWAPFDSTHFFVADDQGVLRLLTILTTGPVVTGLEIVAIGRTSRASSLVYFAEKRMLFVGSHHGDSQLFRVDLSDEGADGGGGGSGGENRYCKLVQTFSNIAPIFDFTVMDMGNREADKQLANEYASGQARIVTGSGVYKDGSLRSIRSGVGLEEIGILDDFSGVRALFSLRLNQATPAAQVDTLVVSFLTETRVFTFDADGGIEEVDSLPGADISTETLWATNIPSGSGGLRILQVTATAVTVADLDSGMTVATWTPPDGKTITSASANARWVLLSVEGTRLVSLSLDHDLALAAETDFGTDQIASIHAAPQLLDTGVVGMWSAGTITLVDLATLEPVQASVSLRHAEDTASVPRSIALAQVLPPHLAGPTLFVAMDDGTVVTFGVATANRSLQARKSIVLGTRHANLHLLPQADGMYNIFATTEHPSLIYSAEGRIVYAAVTAQDANVVCPFDAAAFPGAIVVASLREIKLSRPDTKKQTHVQTIRMGESIRRIAYSPAERVFALGCIAVDVVKGIEVATCSIKLVDEILFQPVGAPLLLEKEHGELVESVIRAELRGADGQPAERFIVGTSYLPSEEDAIGEDVSETGLGRVIIIGVDAERNPYVISAHRMRGPCRCLAVMDGKVVLGLSKTVVVGEYVELSSMSAKLRKIASFRAATLVMDLAVNGNLIAVGDIMKSTTIVEFIPAVAAVPAEADADGNDATASAAAAADEQPATPAQLVSRARYYQASWATAVSHIEGETWLEADGYGNLSVLERNVNGVTAEDRRRLRSTSEINLGEMVNRIRPIAVESSANAMVLPKAFLATVSPSRLRELSHTPEANYSDRRFYLHVRHGGGRRPGPADAAAGEARDGRDGPGPHVVLGVPRVPQPGARGG